MQLTLDAVDLADDPDLGGEQLEWTDRGEWDAIEQAQERSLSGALIVQEGVKLFGRPITLASNNGAWFTRSKVLELQALAAVPLAVHLLTLPDGEQHYVTWNRAAGPAVQAVPLEREVVATAGSLYQLTLRLITVPPPPEPDPEE